MDGPVRDSEFSFAQTSVLFRSSVDCRRLTYIEEAICFTQPTGSMLTSFRNTLIDTPRIMFSQMSGHCDPVKLTHKINHYDLISARGIYDENRTELFGLMSQSLRTPFKKMSMMLKDKRLIAMNGRLKKERHYFHLED